MPEQFDSEDQGRQRQQYQRNTTLETRCGGSHPRVERYRNCPAAFGIRAMRFDGTDIARVGRRPVLDDAQLVIYFAAFEPRALRTLPCIAIMMEAKPSRIVSIGAPLRLPCKPLQQDRNEDQ